MSEWTCRNVGIGTGYASVIGSRKGASREKVFGSFGFGALMCKCHRHSVRSHLLALSLEHTPA